MTVTSARPRASSLRAALLIMLNPGQVVRGFMGEVPLVFSFCISGMAFTLFFLQTGLDRHRVGNLSDGGVALLALTGILYGTLGVATVAAIGWGLTYPAKTDRSLPWALRAFALSYSPALVYASLGVIFNVAFGWNTAIAFGVTGVLWAIGPLIATVREMLGGRLGVSMVIATICGGLVLFGWALIGT